MMARLRKQMMKPVQKDFFSARYMGKFKLDLIDKEGMYKGRCQQEFSVTRSFSIS